MAYFGSALEIQPDLSSAATNLTWLLAACEDATVRRAEEAVRLGERNAKLTQSRDPIVLDSLAAAYAEAGRWDEAAATADAAMKLASSLGQERLANRISARRGLYRQRKPYRIGSTGDRSP